MNKPYLKYATLIALLTVLSTGMLTVAAQVPRDVTQPTVPIAPTESVRAITPPRHPLPDEAASANVKQFSFIVYGDTRGRRDGVEVQYEHSLIIDSMLASIKELEKTPFPVRFVLQTGDAVVDGRDPKQWNKSFTALINRLTAEGGVPYFLAPGNHDLTAAAELDAAKRLEGLRNYLSALAQLIPPDGAQRRLSGYPTFAFGYGNTFVIALDSNIADNETQFGWVKSQLEGLDRKRYTHVIAFFHHPPYSSGPHGGAIVEKPAAGMRTRYLPLFRHHQVELLLTGHEHLFEHWVERYNAPDGRRYRIDEIVTGGGGSPLYAYRGIPDLRDYKKQNETIKLEIEQLVRPGPEPGDNPYHYVIVKVDGERIRLEVVGVDWGKNFKPYRSNRAELGDRP